MVECNVSQLNIGDEAAVLKISGSSELRYRLLEMGIIKGTVIRLNRIAPLGDPLEISVQGFNLTLRKSEAALILVKCKAKSLNNEKQ